MRSFITKLNKKSNAWLWFVGLYFVSLLAMALVMWVIHVLLACLMK